MNDDIKSKETSSHYTNHKVNLKCKYQECKKVFSTGYRLKIHTQSHV